MWISRSMETRVLSNNATTISAGRLLNENSYWTGSDDEMPWANLSISTCKRNISSTVSCHSVAPTSPPRITLRLCLFGLLRSTRFARQISCFRRYLNACSHVLSTRLHDDVESLPAYWSNTRTTRSSNTSDAFRSIENKRLTRVISKFISSFKFLSGAKHEVADRWITSSVTQQWCRSWKYIEKLWHDRIN